MAGLLHDIGHYPFSHAMEEAIDNYYKSKMFDDADVSSGALHNTGSLQLRYFNHERVGRSILEKDPSLRSILNQANIKPDEIYSIFLRSNPSHLNNLISSDLDADRIDYLLRTAHHAGLPYGSVDLFYLLSQMRIDNNRRICITEKALRATNHFLLSRYFDYQQVAFHKTVVALELILKDVIFKLLQDGYIGCSSGDVDKSIENEKWLSFDDISMMRIVQEYAETDDDKVAKMQAAAICQRNPPKLVFRKEFVGRQEEQSKDQIRLYKRMIDAKKAHWADEFDIDQKLWYVWMKPSLTLTKIGSHLPIAEAVDPSERDIDRYEQAIRVLTGNNVSRPIMGMPESLMYILASHALYSIRLYVLLPREAQSKREHIERRVTADLNDRG